MDAHVIDKIVAYLKTQPVLKAWIFGSYSRGEHRPDRDIDIMVSFMPSANVSLLKHASMMVELQSLLHRPVDLVTEKGLMSFARNSVKRDKKLIYRYGGCVAG